MRILAAVVLASSTAAAAPIDDVTFNADRTRARVPVPPVAASGPLQSRVLYINRDGGMVQPGNNNSQTNTSSIVAQPSTIAGWDASDTKWAATMACVREMWAPYDLEVTDVDPGTTPHMEAMIGGTPTAIGFPAGIGGVAPMAIDCSTVERAVVFVFPKNLNHNAQLVCEVIGQELGHSFGLDHELEPSDPMTYLGYNGDRTFRDKTVDCGESSPRPCGIGGNVCSAKQNSFQHLMSRIGESGRDHVPPELDVVTPAAGLVERGFDVVASATDDVEVDRITLFIDGGQVAVDTEMISIATDPELPEGTHELVIEVADTTGNTTTERIDVRIDDGDTTGGMTPDFTPTLGCATSRDPSAVVILLVVVAIAWKRRRNLSLVRRSV